MELLWAGLAIGLSLLLAAWQERPARRSPAQGRSPRSPHTGSSRR